MKLDALGGTVYVRTDRLVGLGPVFKYGATQQPVRELVCMGGHKYLIHDHPQNVEPIMRALGHD